MGILAANAFNPGFCPFVLNLLASFGKLKSRSKNLLWLTEYAHGLEYEIYCIKIPNIFISFPFAVVVRIGYVGNGSLIIGIRRRKPNCKFELYDIMINPINYEIESGDEAIILSTDFSRAQKFEDRTTNDIQKDKEMTYTGSLHYIKNYDYDFNPNKKKNKSRRSSNRSTESEAFNDNFSEWIDDTSNLKDHIIVFGPLEALPSLIECLRHFTNNYICYVNSKNVPQYLKVSLRLLML